MDAKLFESVEITLELCCELRFEVENKNEIVSLTLTSGIAELFGTELIKGKTYFFKWCAVVSIFTWHGCTLQYSGNPNSRYIARETPMNLYLDTHSCLDERRLFADAHGERGPITMIVGPNDVGKKTLSSILLNYAVRSGRTPVFVDLDVSHGSISLAGTVGVTLVTQVSTVHGFCHKFPYVFHYGHTTLSKNPILIQQLVTHLGTTVLQKMQSEKQVNSSGTIINTCAWTREHGLDHLIHIGQSFQVNSILVVGHEKLYYQLVQNVPSNVRVVNLPKSGGVVTRSAEIRSNYQAFQIKKYFCGMELNLSPNRIELKWDDIRIFKIGAPLPPESGLPAGMNIEAVTVDMNILHHLLAIPCSTDFNDILNSNIAGFVCVLYVDVIARILTVLSPQPGPLPNYMFLLNDVKFVNY